MVKKILRRLAVLITMPALLLGPLGGGPLWLSPPLAEATAPVFTNNNAPGGNVPQGNTNIVGMDITLPPIDADTVADCNGTTNNTADCPASQNAGLVVGAGLTAFVTADNVCADNIVGLVPPTIIFTDSDGNCNTTAGTITNILGTAAATTQYAEAEASGSLLVYFNEGAAGWATGEDIVFDLDDSQKLNADTVDAITVRNLGTAVNATDISGVQWWLDTGNGQFNAAEDTIADSVCPWDGASDWECGDNVDVISTTAGFALRIFVTFDLAMTATPGRTVQMQVADRAGNDDGKFDTGEAGIWFANAGAANTGNHDSNAITGGDGNDLSTNANTTTIILRASSNTSAPPPSSSDTSGGSTGEPAPTNTETETITSTDGGSVIETSANDGATATVTAEAGAVAVDTTFTVKAFTAQEVYAQKPLPQELSMGAQSVFDVSATAAGEAVTIFADKPLALRFTYQENRLAQGASEADLRLATFDENENDWYVLEDAILDTVANTITYETTHLTRFALVRPEDVVAPAAPTNLSASVIASGVRLAWQNPAEDFHHTRILRNSARLATNVSGTTYDDATAQSGVGYTYAVAAVDRAGNISTSVQASVVGAQAPTAPPSGPVGSPEDVADGSLVRATNQIEVYVTKKVGAVVIIRHIVNPRVFDVYGHFGGVAAWGKIVGVDSLSNARRSAWVRGSDGKVWEVNGDGTRHHMQMTWEQFASRVASGDSSLATNLIFEVNAAELGLYTTGVSVLP